MTAYKEEDWYLTMGPLSVMMRDYFGGTGIKYNIYLSLDNSYVDVLLGQSVIRLAINDEDKHFVKCYNAEPLLQNGELGTPYDVLNALMIKFIRDNKEKVRTKRKYTRKQKEEKQ